MTRGPEPRPSATADAGSTENDLRRRIAKLERINAALMSHVERVTDKQEGAYSLFQTAIMLDGRVRSRTEELTGLMHQLERSNTALELAKDEAEQANRSKTRFLAAASHDLLQPLHAARLSVSMLGELSLGAVADGMMGRIDRGLAEIEELIRTLLDISKLDAGAVRPDIEAVRLAELFDEVEAMFRPLAEARGLRLVVRCGDGLVADSDGRLLARILGNLVSNAVRYTERGGVLVAARRQGGGCRIDVVDTGCGIPEGERDLVFEEFFRGRASAGDEKGLGLGLAIVRRMAAALGHDLSLRSSVDRGTTFTLRLPLRCPTMQRRRHLIDGTAPATRPRRPRILLVAAAGAAADEVRRMLEGWDYEVAVVRDAAAIAEGTAPPALVLLDHRAAGAGHDARSVVGARSRLGGTVPLAVLLAHDAAPPAEGFALMREPIRPARLRSLIVSLLASNAPG